MFALFVRDYTGFLSVEWLGTDGEEVEKCTLVGGADLQGIQRLMKSNLLVKQHLNIVGTEKNKKKSIKLAFLSWLSG